MTTQQQWAVIISFDAAGAKEWATITQMAARQTLVAPLSRVAILLDKEVLAVPIDISPSSVSTEITGNFLLQSARARSHVLYPAHRTDASVFRWRQGG